jgi:hypothetical protein
VAYTIIKESSKPQATRNVQPTDDGKYLVKGIEVDSLQEANVAMALDRLELDYAYQYDFGIRGVAGSQIIDFLVYTLPRPTPLFVHGEYWHTGSFAIEETIKMEQIKSIMRGTWADPKVIWGDQCETVDDAYVNLQTLLL